MCANYNARLCADFRKSTGARTMANNGKKQCAERSEQSEFRASACVWLDAGTQATALRASRR